MAETITGLLRKYIDLVTESLEEASKKKLSAVPAPAPQEQNKGFGVVYGVHFKDSMKKQLRVFPDLEDKLSKFLDVKLADPLRSRYGKHDGPFATGTPLAGYMHCHLRDDAILIYTLKNRNINLLLICNHADIEGKRQVRTGALLAA